MNPSSPKRTTVQLPARMAEAILEHSRLSYPNEACGLLAGDADGLRMVYCLTNAEGSSTRYTIEPDEHFGALRHAERSGWQLMGAFHSHVHGPAVPSPADLAEAAEPDWVWIVAGPVDGAIELRAYRISEGVAIERELVLS